MLSTRDGAASSKRFCNQTVLIASLCCYFFIPKIWGNMQQVLPWPLKKGWGVVEI